ncbi:MAG: hypothetical protein ACE3JP_14130 [Ectobacillus sp.]
MTILIGLKFNSGVVFVADTKNSDIDASGNSLGPFRSIEKISHISKSIIIATGGLGELGRSIRMLLNSILHVKEGLAAADAIQHVSDTMKFAHHLFKTVNNDISYLDLAAIMGGYDIEARQSFMYILSSANGFKPQRVEDDFITIGPGAEIILKHINENMSRAEDVIEVAQILAEAIRRVDDISVSKDTFSIISFYDSTVQSCKFYRLQIDENGIVNSLPIKC